MAAFSLSTLMVRRTSGARAAQLVLGRCARDRPVRWLAPPRMLHGRLPTRWRCGRSFRNTRPGRGACRPRDRCAGSAPASRRRGRAARPTGASCPRRTRASAATFSSAVAWASARPGDNATAATSQADRQEPMKERSPKRTAERYHQKVGRRWKVQRRPPKSLIVSTLPGGGRLAVIALRRARLGGGGVSKARRSARRGVAGS